MVQSRYVFTPWRDRRELLLVRQQFYGPSSPTPAIEEAGPHLDPSTKSSSSSRDDQHRAVARVSMWMQRGACPHMVESTALLMAAVLSDEESGGLGEASAAATYAVRAAYSAAFSRFVTGLLDGQQEKLRKQSMFSLAKTIGLPATFVELRHQATHEQLPSLARLRAAARRALLWVWGYYWKHLGAGSGSDIKDGSGSGSGRNRDEESYRQLVMAYLREEDGEEGGRMVRRMKRMGDRDGVLRMVGELQETLPGNKAFLKCLKLSRELMAVVEGEDEGEEKDEDEDGEEEKVDEGEGRSESESESERRSEGEGEGEGEGEDEGESEGDTGWSVYSGVWIPKPIGVV